MASLYHTRTEKANKNSRSFGLAAICCEKTGSAVCGPGKIFSRRIICRDFVFYAGGASEKRNPFPAVFPRFRVACPDVGAGVLPSRPPRCGVRARAWERSARRRFRSRPGRAEERAFYLCPFRSRGERGPGEEWARGARTDRCRGNRAYGRVRAGRAGRNRSPVRSRRASR